MSSFQEFLDTADATKLHAEINQVRNQEFLICSFALLLYAASFPAIAQEPGLVIALLLAFSALLYWHYALGAIRTRLSVYLEVMKLSKWERDYRAFADTETYPSQRTAALVLFATLGITSTAWAGWKLYGATVPPNSSGLLCWTIGFLFIVYVLLIGFLGLRRYRSQRAYYEKEWKRVLQQTGSLPRTSS